MADQQSFVASVSAFVAQTKQRIDAVVKESAQRVVEDMQTPVGAGGNMPVDTGYLRASLQASTEAPIPIAAGAKPAEGASYGYSSGPIELVIAGMRADQTLYVTYTANYAAIVNYGRSGRPGRLFVDLAAAKWPQIVNAVCAELQSRVEGSAK